MDDKLPHLISGAAHGSGLDRTLMHALKTDGAIRVFDGRWSLGFVDESALKDAIAKGLLRTEKRHGMTFAVLPNDLGGDIL